jgi:hypothetical protein
MNPVTTMPAIASAHTQPRATPIRPNIAPAEDNASSHELFGVGHHGRRPDPPAHRQLVARHELVARNAHHCGGDSPAHVGGAAMAKQLVDAFEAGDLSAAPNY